MRLAFYCWNKRVYVSFHGFSSLHLLYGLSVQFPSRQHAHAGVDNDRLDWMGDSWSLVYDLDVHDPSIRAGRLELFDHTCIAQGVGLYD